MRLHIFNVHEKNCVLDDVDPSSTILYVRTRIYNVWYIPLPCQLLKYNGRNLEDSETLLDHNIKSGETLHLTVIPDIKIHVKRKGFKGSTKVYQNKD